LTIDNGGKIPLKIWHNAQIIVKIYNKKITREINKIRRLKTRKITICSMTMIRAGT